jgi:hypothetical protein
MALESRERGDATPIQASGRIAADFGRCAHDEFFVAGDGVKLTRKLPVREVREQHFSRRSHFVSVTDVATNDAALVIGNCHVKVRAVCCERARQGKNFVRAR